MKAVIGFICLGVLCFSCMTPMSTHPTDVLSIDSLLTEQIAYCIDNAKSLKKRVAWNHQPEERILQPNAKEWQTEWKLFAEINTFNSLQTFAYHKTHISPQHVAYQLKENEKSPLKRIEFEYSDLQLQRIRAYIVQENFVFWERKYLMIQFDSLQNITHYQVYGLRKIIFQKKQPYYLQGHIL